MQDEAIQKLLLEAQRNEISEHHTYKWLAERVKDGANRDVLARIAKEEYDHYQIFKKLTEEDVPPRRVRVSFYRLISRVLGLSFGLRLMERGEKVTQQVYSELKDKLPELADVVMDEQRHEAEVLGLIEEERLRYTGSIVLGLNDALVELTGALAGLTFALRDGKIIAMTGFITGVAASMSMAASELLSSREEADHGSSKSPSKSAVYTGVAYIVTVLVLILPYLLIKNVYVALGSMMALSVLIILAYNIYVATAKGVGLLARFGTMAAISLTVAGISFVVGMLARVLFGVDV